MLALQLFFLASTGAAVVAGAVHTFRTTLHTQAAVCISVGIVNCWQAYAFFLKGGAQVRCHRPAWDLFAAATMHVCMCMRTF